jgi:hypothetical protein
MALYRMSFKINTYMQRMMLLLLTGKHQLGEDHKILHQNLLNCEVLPFPVDATKYNGDDDDEDIKISEGFSQMESEVDRKATLERAVVNDPSLFHEGKETPNVTPAQASVTEAPAGDADALAAIGTSGAKRPQAKSTKASKYEKHGAPIPDHDFANMMKKLQEEKMAPPKIPCENKLVVGKAAVPSPTKLRGVMHLGAPKHISQIGAWHCGHCGHCYDWDYQSLPFEEVAKQLTCPAWGVEGHDSSRCKYQIK